jgi:uncharacterized protein YgiM (DUF1202 family)
MSTAAQPEVVENEIVETVETVEAPVETPVVEEVKPTTGVVVACSKLNVREAPKADAKILITIDKGATVTILDEVGDFYKIGDKEYCMKKYISVNK